MRRKYLGAGGAGSRGPAGRPRTASRSGGRKRPSRPVGLAINSMWVIIAGLFVFFMQAGFAFLEIGFSRGKNAGTSSRRSSPNVDRGARYWTVGFAFAFGTGEISATTGSSCRARRSAQRRVPGHGAVRRSLGRVLFFQFMFCAVSLAIVWGTTLERIKFGVYVIYSIVFAALIYPIGAHWMFGGGWLQINIGMQDFAGSTAVHLIGATGGSRCCCCSGRGAASTATTASRGRSRGIRCPCSGSGC